jgi:hypothetical protein
MTFDRVESKGQDWLLSFRNQRGCVFA